MCINPSEDTEFGTRRARPVLEYGVSDWVPRHPTPEPKFRRPDSFPWLTETTPCPARIIDRREKASHLPYQEGRLDLVTAPLGCTTANSAGSGKQTMGLLSLCSAKHKYAPPPQVWTQVCTLGKKLSSHTREVASLS